MATCWDAEYADARMVYDWLRERGVNAPGGRHNNYVDKLLHWWQMGGVTTVWQVDQVLTKRTRYHIADLPRAVWYEPEFSRSKIQDWKQDLNGLVRAGYYATDILAILSGRGFRGSYEQIYYATVNARKALAKRKQVA